MEKQIVSFSYWIALVCVVAALVMRIFDWMGLFSKLETKGNPIASHTFVEGAVLFFLAAIATDAYYSSKKY
jgi:hypothetical protein